MNCSKNQKSKQQDHRNNQQFFDQACERLLEQFRFPEQEIPYFIQCLLEGRRQTVIDELVRVKQRDRFKERLEIIQRAFGIFAETIQAKSENKHQTKNLSTQNTNNFPTNQNQNKVQEANQKNKIIYRSNTSQEKLNPEKANYQTGKIQNSKDTNPHSIEEIKKFMQELIKDYKKEKVTQLEIAHLNQVFYVYQLFSKESLIPTENMQDIARKLRGVKFAQNQQTMIQYLNLVDTALQISHNYRLRHTQVIAILMYLQFQQFPKILLQILTGQGKSAIICCLAAILTISGYSVEIVTTSEILAKRDVVQKQNFYKILGLQAADNCEQNQVSTKKCYSDGKIVYGTPHLYQVDILFDEYERRGTRGGRKYEVLIVDQVDSMFVDQKSHQTLLAKTFPGFSELAEPMKIIWEKINTFPIIHRKQKLLMLLPSQKNQTIVGQAKQIMQEVVKDIKQKFQNQIIPQWRLQYVNLSLEKWIQSAVKAAFVLKRRKHYQIVNKDIAPVDHENTGAIQKSVHWENGLHQFLQIKHNLPFTTQGMTSNFISNLAHFDRYQFIYGLTGTLGSAQAKRFLQKTYNATMMQIPPFKKRRLEIIPGNVVYDSIKTINYIVEKICEMMEKQRSVLVISQMIQDVEFLRIALQKKVKRKDRNVKKIVEFKTGQQVISDKLDTNEVVLATNLAGRGTDFKISETLNSNGGLHVIMGFMPKNFRVQMQGRGRAGRSGANGSSQVVVNYSQYMSKQGQRLGFRVEEQQIFYMLDQLQSISFLAENVRDLIQKSEMREAQLTVKKLRFKDSMFNIYCQGISKIPGFRQNRAKRLAIEEAWAMYLKRFDDKDVEKQQKALSDVKSFVQNLIRNHQNHYNPNHYIFKGADLMNSRNYKSAIQQFQEVQKKNSGKIPQMIANTYSAIALTNQNPKDKGRYEETVRKLQKSNKLNLQKQQIIKGICSVQSAGLRVHIQQKYNAEEQDTLAEFNNKLRSQQTSRIAVSQFKSESMELRPQEQSLNLQNYAANIISDNPRIRVLEAIMRHTDSTIQKIKNLGEGKYIEFRKQRIEKLLDIMTGDMEENAEELKKWKEDGGNQLWVPEEKKIEICWWKRACIFALGVMQIAIGSLILNATGGALAGFGCSLIFKGVQFCYDAIFDPNKFDNFGQYLTKAAILHGIQLVTAGMPGINQLANLSKKGFSLIKQLSYKQLLCQLSKGVTSGLQKMKALHGLSLTEMIGKAILLQRKQIVSDQINHDVSQIIAQNKDVFRKQANQSVQQQANNQLKGEIITQQFKYSCQKQIKRIIKQQIQNQLLPLKNLNIPKQHLQFIINHAFSKQFYIEDKIAMNKKLGKFVTLNIESQDLGKLFVREFGVQLKVKNTLESLASTESYQQVIKNAFCNQIKITIDNFIGCKKKALSQKEKIFQIQKKQFEDAKSSMTVAQANKFCQNFNAEGQQYRREVDDYNKSISFIKQLKIDQVYSKLRQNRTLELGQVDTNELTQFHPFVIEALKQLKFESCQKSFEQILQTCVYNEIIAFGVRGIQHIIEQTSGSRQRINQFARMIEKQARK